ncbi:hypothetical protein OG612_45255 (plasmid) [Streptomyces sp. NBC_01527]|uniref:hypothetical protein n=1 Tax=Streptomyces sp. NBC_01527 TaxID=2903894 RepID=UPI002F90FFBF
MTARQQSNKPRWSDWRLAHEAVWLRQMARHSDHPQAEAERLFAEAFTVEEIRRIDNYLAAGVPDTDRLAAVIARLDATAAPDDTKWLVQQLERAWAQLDELRDRIDDAGSRMDTGYVASAIGYVSGTREAG